jgi:hypothetical protein
LPRFIAELMGRGAGTTGLAIKDSTNLPALFLFIPNAIQKTFEVGKLQYIIYQIGIQ